MTQRILESLGSDEVDSIEDTEEASAVANIIKECYYEIVGRNDLPEDRDIYQLTASGDSSKPTLMYMPDEALELKLLKYNDDGSWYEVRPVSLDEFITRTGTLDDTLDTVGSMTITNRLSQTFTFKYRNDVIPNVYTSFDDDTLLFDSYDSDVNSTLVGAKTMCWGLIEPDFTMTDAFTPNLDARQFQLLLQAAKAQSFVELKQVENPKAERKERRNEIVAQRTKQKVGERLKYRGYGRK